MSAARHLYLGACVRSNLPPHTCGRRGVIEKWGSMALLPPLIAVDGVRVVVETACALFLVSNRVTAFKRGLR